MHLFKGCTDDCCSKLSTTHYHDPTSVKATTESTMYNATLATTESDCDTTEGGISSTAFYPTDHINSTVTTNDGSSSNMFNPNGTQNPLVAATSFSSSMSIANNVLVIAVTVTVTIIAILAIILIPTCLLLLVKCRRKCIHTEPFSSQISPKFGSESNQNSPRNKATTKDSTVLIIYSPKTVEKEQDLIHALMSKLEEYDKIETLSHDFTCIQGGPSAWLESEAKKATIVLCVCNKEFKDDWEEEEESQQVSLPLVRSLRHLIHGTIQSGRSLSKFAVVLLDRSHKDYIPTMYLQSDSRQFILTDTEAIAKHVLNMPSYELSKESTCNQHSIFV